MELKIFLEDLSRLSTEANINAKKKEMKNQE